MKGAFSGAVRDEPGFVRAADRGTLFLDEVGDLPAGSQVALLRVLQEGEVVPLGSSRVVNVDVRVVAATHLPLATLAASGRFRKDLLARLEGFVYTLPPLHERREDIGLMVASFVRRLKDDPAAGHAAALTFSTDAGRALYHYDWPANVRELGQCIARAAALAGADGIQLAHLPPDIARAVDGPRFGGSDAPLLSEADATVRATLVAALAAHHGNVAEVAKAMGKARMQIHRWLKRFRIDPATFRH